jgi:hypothetical protein
MIRILGASGLLAATLLLASGALADDALMCVDARRQAHMPVENGISVGLRLAWASPLGNTSGNESLHSVANGQLPVEFDAGYLVNPYLVLGAYVSYGIVPVPSSFGGGTCGTSGFTCSGGDVRVGADVQYRFLGRSALQPWVGLGFLGYERLHVSVSSVGVSVASAYDGVEWITPQAGFDYKIIPALSAGVFAGISFSQYLGASFDENGSPSGRTFEGNPLHSWVFVGGRVTYDLRL